MNFRKATDGLDRATLRVFMVRLASNYCGFYMLLYISAQCVEAALLKPSLGEMNRDVREKKPNKTQ